MQDFFETEAGMLVGVAAGLLLLVVLLVAFLTWRDRRRRATVEALSTAVVVTGAPAAPAVGPLPPVQVLSHALLRAMMATTYLTPQWNGSLPASSLSDDDLCFVEATSEKVVWHSIIGGEWPYLCGRMNHALNYRMASFRPDDYAGPLRTYLLP